MYTFSFFLDFIKDIKNLQTKRKKNIYRKQKAEKKVSRSSNQKPYIYILKTLGPTTLHISISNIFHIIRGFKVYQLASNSAAILCIDLIIKQ